MTVFLSLCIKQHLSDVFHIVSHHAKANLRRATRVLVEDGRGSVHVLSVKGQHVVNVQLLLTISKVSTAPGSWASGSRNGTGVG